MTYPLYIDVSSFQPATVDWKAYVSWARQWDSVARLACRASEGTGVGDAHYASYVSGIRSADPNAIIIHYHYAYPQLNTAADEVNWMASQVSALGARDIIMLDFEENATTETNADWALSWLQNAEVKFGRLPVIYASLSMVQNRLQDSRLTKYPLILADWTANQPPPPAPWHSVWAWQYTDSLSGVPGFGSAKVDANMFLATSSHPLILHNGCVLDLQKSYQLDGGSQDKCGPWSVSELRFAGLPGKGPNGSASDVQAWAHEEYQKYIGPDVVSDQNGSSIDNMHAFLTDATDPKTGHRNLHWYDVGAISPTSQQPHDNAEIIAALNAGYPVLVTVNEQSVVRRNGSNPYPWQPALGPVNHIFTIVGHTSDGYFLVDDELNQGDAWPDQYSMSRLQIHWASVVQVVGPDPSNPWLAPIPSGDPLSWSPAFNAQQLGEALMGVPQGWTDDGKALKSPNGHYAVLGFREYILGHNWDPNNWLMEEEYHADPLEYSNPSLGAGQKQSCRWTTLEWTPEKGVFEAWQGQEIVSLTAMYNAAKSALAQVGTLQQELAACQAASGGVSADLQAAINTAQTTLQTLDQQVQSLEAQLNPFVK